MVSSSELGDRNYISKDGLTELFILVGLDPDKSRSIADVFAQFVTTEKDQYLASEYEKGARPPPIPGSAYTQNRVTNDGTFDAAVSYTFDSSGANSLTAADLNSDGVADLVTASPDNLNMSVMLANSDGSFKASTIYADPFPLHNAVVADFNSDATPDIMASAGNDGYFKFYAGNGDGTFRDPVNLEFLYGQAYELKAADINQDGKQDLISRDDFGRVIVQQGNGDATFKAGYGFDLLLLDPFPVLGVADLNGDGFGDIVTGSNPGMYITMNESGGTFPSTATIDSITTPLSLALHDLNKDGKIDLIAGRSDRISYMLGNGDGSFNAPSSLLTGAAVTGVTAVDINGDLNPDIVGATTLGPVIFYGIGDGTFTGASYQDLTVNAQELALADLNSDGALDLIVSDAGAGEAHVYSGNTQTAAFSSAARISNQFESIFDSERSIATRPGAYDMLNDLKALKSQLKKNLSAIDEARGVLEDNIKLVRVTGLAMLDLSSQIKSDATAAQVAQLLQEKIRSDAGAALSQAENLDPIMVAVLTLASSSSSTSSA
jgi:hypothetical protein